MAKRGPKIKTINWEQFDSLCGIQCTLEEIAAFFKCSEDTIERICVRELGVKFADIYQQKAANGKISIRRAMFQKAKDNPTMMIWWSKNHLGMSDKIEQKLDATAKISADVTIVEYKTNLSELTNDPDPQTESI